jgi:hypothetical protein
MARQAGCQGSQERRRGRHGQQACTDRMGRLVQRKGLQASNRAGLRGKDAFGLETLRVPTFPHYDDPFIKFPTEVCIGAARTKEQSQRRVYSLILRMVFNDRRVYKDRHARISSWPGETIST